MFGAVDVMIAFDYLQLRAFHAAVSVACGTLDCSLLACLPAAVRQCIYELEPEV